MMRKLLVSLAALAPAASPAAAIEPRDAVHVTPPAVPHPLPQGVPYVSIGHAHQPVITLRYGLIDGRRVLFEPVTGEIVYILQP
jgi:hypothetical protein